MVKGKPQGPGVRAVNRCSHIENLFVDYISIHNTYVDIEYRNSSSFIDYAVHLQICL